jgi:cytochrome P450
VGRFQAGHYLRAMSRASIHDTKYYGLDASDWKGQRFHEQEGLYSTQLAFGGGKTWVLCTLACRRSFESACPGRFLAVFELQLMLAHLVRNFDFSDRVDLRRKTASDAPDFHIEARRHKGAKMRVVDLDGSPREISCPNVPDFGALRRHFDLHLTVHCRCRKRFWLGR